MSTDGRKLTDGGGALCREPREVIGCESRRVVRSLADADVQPASAESATNSMSSVPYDAPRPRCRDVAGRGVQHHQCVRSGGVRHHLLPLG